MNIALLCGKNLNDFELKVVEPFLKSSDHIFSVCIIDGRPKKSLLQRLAKNLKRGRGGYVLIMAFRVIWTRKKHIINTEMFFKTKNIPTIVANEPYSEDTINKIRSYVPDVMILIGGFGIIKKPLLNNTKYGILSYHHGNMRKYRGQPPTFWELYNGEKEMGVTVQRICEDLDCGEPIIEKTIPIKNSDTLKSLKKRAFDESVDMMYKAIDLLEKNDFCQEKITRFGKLYTLPNFWQWVLLNMKIIYRHI